MCIATGRSISGRGGDKQTLNAKHSEGTPVVQLTGVSKSFDGKEIIANLT
ncbi:hypothetical protein JCM19240_2709 [Vibrio maritimus]|uniref:Uncharacterized protein n=1 Tax=Vibrio maritimus TaxID=990268 RepID=A0A090T9I4_9VIBR|nr:hypothetical protein JCM19240_2709 [Vibrio maritimus]